MLETTILDVVFLWYFYDLIIFSNSVLNESTLHLVGKKSRKGIQANLLRCINHRYFIYFSIIYYKVVANTAACIINFTVIYLQAINYNFKSSYTYLFLYYMIIGKNAVAAIYWQRNFVKPPEFPLYISYFCMYSVVLCTSQHMLFEDIFSLTFVKLFVFLAVLFSKLGK